MIELLNENDKFITVRTKLKPEYFQNIGNIPILDGRTKRMYEIKKNTTGDTITVEYQKIISEVKKVELMGYGTMKKDETDIYYTYKIYF